MKPWTPKVVEVREYIEYMFDGVAWHDRDKSDERWNIWLKYRDGEVHRLDHVTGRLFTIDGRDIGHGISLVTEYLVYGSTYKKIVIGGE